MIDMFGLPNRNMHSTQIYTSRGSVLYAAWDVWQKPKGVSMVNIITIGGGGGGGGGMGRTAGTAGGGGGSGACSGIARFLCPACFLPDQLYIHVGVGGQGGAGTTGAAGAGVAGMNSFVCIARPAAAIPVLPNIVCYSGVNAPGGGGAGTAAAAGPAGTIPTIAVTQPINAFGQWFATVGLVGIIGGVQTGAAGTGPTAWAALTMCAGGSGAGCTTTDFAGGPVTQTAAIVDLGQKGYFPSGSILAAGGVSPGGHGNKGISCLAPFFQTGGSGGASNNSGVAGNGGDGGIGCGGGGGGAGTTGGRGGNGGEGLVIITAW